MTIRQSEQLHNGVIQLDSVEISDWSAEFTHENSMVSFIAQYTLENIT